MIEPRGQYVTTKDGVSIGYVVTGTGHPLVYLQPHSHALRAWELPEPREWYTRIAARFRLIQVDIRHFGLSQRDAGPISVETCVSDVEAVVDHLELGQFALMAVSGLTASAAAYAVRHHEQVEKLVLWSAAATSGALSGRQVRNRSTEAVMEEDPDLGYELHSRFLFGDHLAPRVDQQEFVRAAMGIEGIKEYANYYRAMDVTALLPQIAVPTLVVYPRLTEFLQIDPVRRIAGAIPNSEFVELDAAMFPFQGPDLRNTFRVVEAFLTGRGQSDARRTPVDRHHPSDCGPLSVREREIFVLVAEGRTNREIAADLVLSERTVARHVANIYVKIGVHNRAQATAYAFENGVL